MNNKIKQLAEQADEYADTKLQMPGEYHPDWHDVRDEKFAESIIKECAGLVEDYYDEDTKYLAGHIIRKHFGVK